MTFSYDKEEFHQLLITWFHELHQIPETGLYLPKTSAYIEKQLTNMGLDVKHCSKSSGMTALIAGTQKDRTAAIRADMDGLPIKELTSLPYASQNGCMHACGHDSHMAMALGAAWLLSKHRTKMNGQVKLIFEPAEESVGGAHLMIEEGVLHNPDVDVIFGQHAGNIVEHQKRGSFTIQAGPIMASRDSFTMTVSGTGCHGATPGAGVDPVVISAHIILALQTLVSREINGTDQAVLTIGSIKSGDAYNIIPSEAVILGSFRCLDEKIRGYYMKRIPEIAEGVAGAMRASVSFLWDEGLPITKNDTMVTNFVKKTAENYLPKERICSLNPPVMISEDMSWFLNKVPGCFWFFATNPDEQPVMPHHSPYFKIDETFLDEGSEFLAYIAYQWLNN